MAKSTSEAGAKKMLFTPTDDNRKKIRAVSYQDEISMQDIINEALQDWFTRYEKKNGKIPVK